MPLPYGPGSSGPEIEYWQTWFTGQYSAYAPARDGYYCDDDAAAVSEMQRRLNLPQTGVFDSETASRAGYESPVPDLRPIMFTVEGHCSDMFRGPVADTGRQLEVEGLCHHQPIGYNNAPIPFDNASGLKELARLVGARSMPNMVPFPPGTPWLMGGFSQGGIIISDFYFDYLAPGKPLSWRTPDLKGVLAYGNPCRKTDSVADWARPWVKRPGTHGLDPIRRFGLPGYPDQPDFWVEVYREGDIFAENGDDKPGQMKAAVYEAVARNVFLTESCSLAARLAKLFDQPVETVMAIILACIKGINFLGQKENPHYAPYDISGGVDWLRNRLSSPPATEPPAKPPVTPVEARPSGADTRPTLQMHADGEAVGRLQTLLRKRGYDLDVDGRFGRPTRSAVKAFQHRHGLRPDAVVGPDTWTALEDGEPAENLQPHDACANQPPDVTHVDVAGVTWESGLDPAAWKLSWRNPLVASDPPGYTGGPGPERESAWRSYLSHFPMTERGLLPDPLAVTDRGLRVIGNAATQLGTSYASGAKGFDGPGPGNLYDDDGGDARRYADDQRIGFDSSGLAQFAAWQTCYTDIGMSAANQAQTGSLHTVAGGQSLKPGDFLFYGSTPTHVAIYVAPGVIIDAPHSGRPVELHKRTTVPGPDPDEVLIVARRLPAASQAAVPAQTVDQ